MWLFGVWPGPQDYFKVPLVTLMCSGGWRLQLSQRGKLINKSYTSIPACPRVANVSLIWIIHPRWVMSYSQGFSVPWAKNSFRSHLSMSFCYGKPKKKSTCSYTYSCLKAQDRKKQCAWTFCSPLPPACMLEPWALAEPVSFLHTFCGFTGVDTGPHWAQACSQSPRPQPPPPCDICEMTS